MAVARLLILSPVRLHRESLAWRIRESELPLEVVGAFADLASARRALGGLKADVALVDFTGTDPLQHIRVLRARPGLPPVVALALTPSDRTEAAAFAAAGISGFVPPGGDLEDLVREVAKVLKRDRAQVTIEPLPDPDQPAAAGDGAASSLTARQKQVFRLLQEGLTNKEIARVLQIRTATVKNHVHSVLLKLGVRRRSEIAARLLGRPGSRGPSKGKRSVAVRTVPAGPAGREGRRSTASTGKEKPRSRS